MENYLIGPAIIGVETFQEQIERRMYLISKTSSEGIGQSNINNRKQIFTSRKRYSIKGDTKE